MKVNPFNSWATILDCGDIPVTSYDNKYAIEQIEKGHLALLTRPPKYEPDLHRRGPSLEGKVLPRVITLGGDHTIVLPILRSVKKAYGPVSVIHFDSHLDVCGAVAIYLFLSERRESELTVGIRVDLGAEGIWRCAD